jgi:hypothetical protein
MKKLTVYEVESENLSNVGGPMGTDRTYTNWTRLASSIEKCIEIAEKDYKKNGGDETIKWDIKKNSACSGDLGFVMYNIYKKEVE